MKRSQLYVVLVSAGLMILILGGMWLFPRNNNNNQNMGQRLGHNNTNTASPVQYTFPGEIESSRQYGCSGLRKDITRAAGRWFPL
jgi:hypothetical protein